MFYATIVFSKSNPVKSAERFVTEVQLDEFDEGYLDQLKNPSFPKKVKAIGHSKTQTPPCSFQGEYPTEELAEAAIADGGEIWQWFVNEYGKEEFHRVTIHNNHATLHFKTYIEMAEYLGVSERVARRAALLGQMKGWYIDINDRPDHGL